MYDMIAPFYDEVNLEIDYVAWADFLEACIRRFYTNGRPELVLDLGCGTGRMTLELARRGYDMTGIDNSPDMLGLARDLAEEEQKAGQILLLCQDMTAFELYGTVDVTVSCLDCLNHLTTPRQLQQCLALVHNYLIPDGLFLFDINGRRKFETVYADEIYTIETEDSYCIWENHYDKKTQLCAFGVTVFTEQPDGRYTREDDVQTERMYTLKTMREQLEKAGFEWLGAYADFAFTEGTDEDERLYIVARCKKPMPAVQPQNRGD